MPAPPPRPHQPQRCPSQLLFVCFASPVEVLFPAQTPEQTGSAFHFRGRFGVKFQLFLATSLFATVANVCTLVSPISFLSAGNNLLLQAPPVGIMMRLQLIQQHTYNLLKNAQMPF